MRPPTVTRAQVVELVGRAITSATDGRVPPVVVGADPDVLPALVEVEGRVVRVEGSRSPLQIRSLLASASDGPLVVLTDCEPATLGDDVVARAFGRKVQRVDRWATVCGLFGADRPAPALVRKPHLADALIEAAPLGDYPRVASRVLDLETATAALVRVSVGVPDEVATLAGLLAWLGRPEAAGRIAAVRNEVRADVHGTLRARFGEGVDAVVAALDAGRAADLVPLGLVASVLHARLRPGEAEGPEVAAAAVRLDERLGAPGLTPGPYQAWGAAAAEAVAARADDPAWIAGVVERTEALLGDLGALAAAHRSDLLPAGFDQRVHLAAQALSRWREEPRRAELATRVAAAIALAAAHRGGQRAADRVERLQMVARLLRRGSPSLEGLDDLVAAAHHYETDGAWLDAARTVVSRGDSDGALAALCAALTAEADAAREADGARFARIAAGAAVAVPDPLVGLEDVLDRVVAPLAAQRPVMVVVLDGMSWPTFTEVVGALEGSGWSAWRSVASGSGPGSVGVAVLPTVTEVSRTSLLAGRLRRGDDASERRAFATHAALGAVTRGGPPPELFHKSHLRMGGLDVRPDDVLSAVADERRRVVGLVINNIDERLKDVAQPVGAWGWRDLDPLRQVLDAARRAGRAVVLTADHGHVLDRDAEARPGGAGGGERWRPADRPAEEGEVVVHGPRVVADGNEAVLAWREQLRYGPRRNGYHGGISPRELFVPVVVLSTDDLPDGWAPAAFRRPPWWYPAAVIPPAAAAPTPAVAAPTLFDAPASAAAPAVASEPGWVDALLASPDLERRRRSPRVRLGDPELRRLLAVLDRWTGTAVPLDRLAAEADLPAARIGRYVAQLQELLNVEGYGVVTTTGDEVRLDRALLLRQFSVDGPGR